MFLHEVSLDGLVAIGGKRLLVHLKFFSSSI